MKIMLKLQFIFFVALNNYCGLIVVPSQVLSDVVNTTYLEKHVL